MSDTQGAKMTVQHVDNSHSDDSGVHVVERVHADGTVDLIDAHAIGGDLDEMPVGYFITPNFICTFLVSKMISKAWELKLTPYIVSMSCQYLCLSRMGSSCEYSYFNQCRYWTFFGYQLGWHELDSGKQVCELLLSLESLLTYSSVGFLIFGRLSDIFGRKYLVIAFQVLGLIGCIVGATAQSINVLIGSNLLNGIAAAGQLSFGIIIGELVPNKLRGPAIALIFLSSLPFAGTFKAFQPTSDPSLTRYSLWTVDRPCILHEYRSEMEMELLPWHHLQRPSSGRLRSFLPPSNLRSTPRPRQNQMATVQRTRFHWTFPLPGWLRPFSYRSQLGWFKIYLDICSRSLLYHHRCRYTDCFRLVRSVCVQRTSSYATPHLQESWILGYCYLCDRWCDGLLLLDDPLALHHRQLHYRFGQNRYPICRRWWRYSTRTGIWWIRSLLRSQSEMAGHHYFCPWRRFRGFTRQYWSRYTQCYYRSWYLGYIFHRIR